MTTAINLRQAHALITISRLLADLHIAPPGWATEGPFDMAPFDQDAPGRLIPGPDMMTGGFDLTPPETPGYNARSFFLELSPAAEPTEIDAVLSFNDYSYGGEPEEIFRRRYDISPAPQANPDVFREDAFYAEVVQEIVQHVMLRAAQALTDRAAAR